MRAYSAIEKSVHFIEKRRVKVMIISVEEAKEFEIKLLKVREKSREIGRKLRQIKKDEREIRERLQRVEYL
jgi:hypothetical protein